MRGVGRGALEPGGEQVWRGEGDHGQEGGRGEGGQRQGHRGQGGGEAGDTVLLLPPPGLLPLDTVLPLCSLLQLDLSTTVYRHWREAGRRIGRGRGGSFQLLNIWLE